MQALQMGTLLKGRYRLLRPLGEGGMGQVFLGEDESITEGSRLVAIKALRVDLREKTGQLFLRRFQEEVQILQRVHAPGVPAFVDAFEHESRSILIMEYIEGHSLAELLDRSREQQVGGLPPWLVAEVGIQVCRVLEHLHGQVPPLIHRDIKPPNVIIRSQDDLVFLVDFGLAREFHEESQARTLVGTVGYCPLEQFQGQPEPRSDLYALGATMFELVTGCIPRSLNIPSVQSVLPSVHPDLARVINLCLRTTPVERPTDAACLRMLLKEAQQNLESGAVSPVKETSTGDRVNELIYRWGRGRAVQPTPVEQPSFPVLPKPLKLKRLQAPRRWPSVLRVLVLLTLVLAGLFFGGRQRYLSDQRELVHDALPDGAPHPGWRLQEALGLFPAEGLGLGEPNRDWDFSQRSGVVFAGGDSPPTMMSFSVRRVKGTPRLLVFCRPLGVLLEPRKDKYELRVVRLEGPVTLRDIAWDEDDELPKVQLGAFRQLEVRLSLAGPRSQLWVDKRPPLSFETGDGSVGQCGIVLLNAVKKTRCVVEQWQLP